MHAVEIAPEAVEIMRRRGVRHVTQGNLPDADLEPNDTLFMLMNLRAEPVFAVEGSHVATLIPRS